jgi:cold shock CspA family protein
MESGVIRSFSIDKGFGFIDSQAGESLFFHVSDVQSQSRPALKIGAFVSFDAVPRPKGMAATDVAVQHDALELYLPPTKTKFLFSKTEEFKDSLVMVHKGKLMSVETKNPTEGRELMRNLAQKAGFNGICNFSCNKRTGQSWTNGNYKYTIHVFRGQPALLKLKTRTMDANEAKANKTELEREIASFSEAKIENRSVNDASAYAPLLFAISAIGLGIFALWHFDKF